MTKKEREQMVAMCQFISNIYASCGMEIPENFNAEEESMIVFNACREIGKKNLALALLSLEKDRVNKEILESHLETIKTAEG